MKILAIDPGLSTGMVYVEDNNVLDTFLATKASEVLNRVNGVRLHEFVVLIEDFVGSGPRTKEAIFVLKLIGGVLGVCHINNTECILQTPMQRKPFVNESRHRLPKGTIIHIVDAYAHALAYLEKVSQ